MNPETLLNHLYSLDVSLTLTGNARSLELDAPKGVMTPELLEWVKELRSDLVELVYCEEERKAIRAESETLAAPTLIFTGDELLIEQYRRHPLISTLEKAFASRGGATVELLRAA